MNDRIKELAEQAGFVVGVSANADRQIKLFAELVRQDEREAIEREHADALPPTANSACSMAWRSA